MADTKISALTAASAAAGANEIPINEAGTTKKITVTQIVTAVKAAGAEITTGTEDAKFVTPKALADATVGKLGAAWATWSPSLTNITAGAGTVVAKYAQIGKTIHYFFRFILAADSAIGTNPTFSLPVTAISAESGHIGICKLDDANGSEFAGFVVLASTTTARPQILTHGTSYISLTDCTATVPFTWTTSDQFICHGTYEAA